MAMLLLLFIVIAVGYFTLIIFYSIGWSKTKYFSFEEINGRTTLSRPTTKISVVIAARNEEKNISNCLLYVLNQNYPKELFEVIVVDDNSEDGTVDVVKQLQSEFDNLFIRQFDNETIERKSFKKEAITKGVEMARGELIVVTDADCIAEKNWLQTIAAYYEIHQPKMLVMPVRFCSENVIAKERIALCAAETEAISSDKKIASSCSAKSRAIPRNDGRCEKWLHDFQQTDLSGLIGITAGSLFWNMPVMANGGNMAFEKKTFEAVNGFSGNENIPGGDDIFLLLKIKKQFPGSIQFLKSKEVIVTTKPVSSFTEFYHQRLRWISKSGKFGDWKITAMLVLSYLFNFLLLLNLILSIVLKSKTLLTITGIIFLLKWLIEFTLVKNVSAFLNHPFSVSKFILSNLLHQLYVIVFGILALFNKYEWKGRKYN
jgi:cellulose synthase/poly-beta-1,6-N-acetylglucosamine synthase-like glycosyltransferase